MNKKKDMEIALEKMKEKRRQYKLALSGDSDMLIKLGIEYLDQTDKPDKSSDKEKTLTTSDIIVLLKYLVNRLEELNN